MWPSVARVITASVIRPTAPPIQRCCAAAAPKTPGATISAPSASAPSGQEGVTRVEDRDERLGQRPVPGPAGEPREMQRTREHQRGARGEVEGQRHPEEERGEEHEERHLVEPLHRRHGEPPGAALREPVPGEGRNDPSRR